MIDFSDVGERRRWFEGQPREIGMTMISRSALRMLPLIYASRRSRITQGFLNAVVAPAFRAGAIASASAKYPNHDSTLRNVARSAFEAAEAAARTARIEVPYAPSGSALALPAELAADAVGAIATAVRLAASRMDAASQAPHIYFAPQGVAAFASDAAFIGRVGGAKERAARAIQCAGAPLWPAGMPVQLQEGWDRLKAIFLNAGDDWEVWIDWYADLIAGGSSIGTGLDLAWARIPDALWEQGPRVANAEIRRLLDEGRKTPNVSDEPIPPQGAGPHFALSPVHKIGLAAASEIDPAGNNLGRLRQQLPLVREAADDLAGRLNPNAFPELARNLTAYRGAIEGEPEAITWGVVFGRGVRLDNAAAAARRQIEDRLQPPLEDAAREALESVLTLHGPMILATAEGRELMDDANRMLLTREEQAALRADALAVAMALKEDKEVIEPPAAELVMEAVETIGEGPHPERGSVVGGAAIRNVTIWAVGVAAIAAVAGVGFVQAGVAVIAIEGLKKSKRFSALTDALGARIDGVRRTGAAFQNFVIKNEQPLRQMASNSVGMRWMLPYIDDVVRRNAGRPPRNQP